MTKTELQVALAVAAETNKRTSGVFLDTLSALAYKEVKKTGEFVFAALCYRLDPNGSSRSPVRKHNDITARLK
jgi:hypothetical protein